MSQTTHDTTASDAGISDHWDQVEEASELLVAGRIDEATLLLEKLTTTQPSNAYAFFFLGNAHFEKHNLSQALRAYLRALELSPRYLGAIVACGHTLRMLGKPREAIRMGRQALLIDRNDQDALYLLGVCHYACGDVAAAIKYLHCFLDTRPEAEAAFEARAILQQLEVPSPES